MSRRLALIAAIACTFGIGAYRALGTLSPFALANLLVGTAALLSALALLFLRAERIQRVALRRPAAIALGQALGIALLAALLYLAAAHSGWRFDWTFEGRYQLAPATTSALDALPDELRMTLYRDEGDPRIRHTRMLLEQLATGHRIEVQNRLIEQSPADEDRFGIASSNTVVVERGDRWERVDRPNEGTLLEAMLQLTTDPTRLLYVGIGAGEGDLERGDALGYSGLRAALETEGYRLQPLPLAAIDRVPEDADGVLLLAPRRALGENAIAALTHYVDAGGAIIAFLEPDTRSGLEGLLAHYGLHSPDALVIDPESGAFQGDPPGLDPLVRSYAGHAVTRGLDHNRMTFFRRARAFQLRKARPDDRLVGLAFSSGEAWLAATTNAGPSPTSSRPLRRPGDVRGDYRALVAAAEVRRGGPRARILAFGDADLASNRNLRTLYNLDLVMNGIHWTLAREPAITLRPKTGGRQMIQFPVPLQNSLRAFYGMGLLVPELSLVAGGLIWLRQRRA